MFWSFLESSTPPWLSFGICRVLLSRPNIAPHGRLSWSMTSLSTNLIKLNINNRNLLIIAYNCNIMTRCTSCRNRRKRFLTLQGLVIIWLLFMIWLPIWKSMSIIWLPWRHVNSRTCVLPHIIVTRIWVLTHRKKHWQYI